MKALTIRQPYAGLILASIKTEEIRNWKTDFLGPLAIHSAKKEERGDEESVLGFKSLSASRCPAWIADKGVILGVVEVVGYVYVGQKQWAWQLANPRLLIEPVPYKGALGFFTVPDELLG